MNLINPTRVELTEEFKSGAKPITKKDPAFLKRTIEAILRDHQTAVHLGFSLFKVRVARANSGKSGGYRVFYYVMIDQIAYALACIDKKERENLTPKEINALREFVQILEEQKEKEKQ